MTNDAKMNPPKWFWLVSIIALLWNLMGVVAYLSDAYMSVSDIEAMTQAQRELHESQPAWVTAGYAIAVFGGTMGCVFLLLRNKWARTILLISLFGVIVQQFYMTILSNTFEVYGNEALILPFLVLIIAIALVIFAKNAQSKAWLK